MAQAPFQAQCACGSVVFEARGAKLATIACYCDDCQAVSAQIMAMPSGKSGIGPDAGTVSTLFRKDMVRCVKGSEKLTEHKLRPGSPATRLIASCCNSNMVTKFDNWLPMNALRTYASTASIVPTMCINTKWAPDAAKITHSAPRHPKIPPSLGLKVVGAAVMLALPLGDGRLG